MNVLFLALYPPYPPVDGGRLRTYNILKQVASRHLVTLVCFGDRLSTSGDLEKLGEFCEQVIVVPLPSKPARTFIARIRDLPRRKPIGLRDWQSDEMRATLADLVKEKNFQLAHIDHLILAQYVADLSTLPRVLTHHNIESFAIRREMKFTDHYSCFRTWANWLENKRWEWFEIAASSSVEVIVTVSKNDSDYFSQFIPNTLVHTVPNGVDTARFQPQSHSSDIPNLLFTGRMDYMPNVDAMSWFCSEIFPLIQKNFPGATLTIAGRSPTIRVQALGNLPSVNITGMVEDMRPYYGSATVFIVPLRFGGGTRLKILEAMSMGMSIVSTPLGCEGLELIDGEDLLIADTPEKFANAVLRLLMDRDMCAMLSQRARQTAKARFDWTIIGNAQEQAYQQALKQKSL